MKQIFKKSILFAMTGVMLLGSIVPTFATVNEKQTVSANNNAQTEVIYNQESTFGVTVPKKVDLGSDKTTNYTVTVFGDIASDETIIVKPDKSFEMVDTSTINTKKPIPATVEQDKETWKFNEFETVANGEIKAPELSAGNWQGSFFFNIKLSSDYISVNAKNEAGEDLNATATQITGERKDTLLNLLEKTGYVASKDEVDALINVKSDDFEGLAETTFDVSNIAKEGDTVIILHFDEAKQEWEYIGTETVNAEGTITGDFTSYSPVAFVKVTEDGNYEQINNYATTFADNSWSDIAKACQTNNVPDTWKVGDIKTMLVDGVEYEVAIIGKNHDIYADNEKTAPLTFQMVGTLQTSYAMQPLDYNVGGWDGSMLYETLNTTIFNTIEDDVKNNIKAVSKTTHIGKDDDNGKATTVRISSDKLFLVSVVEVFGWQQYNIWNKEGTQYEYYKIENNRRKEQHNSNPGWWLRSPAGDSRGYCLVGYFGDRSGSTSSAVRHVSFAFCF